MGVKKTLGLLLGVFVLLSETDFAYSYEDLPDDQVLLRLLEKKQEVLLPKKINLLVWNIEKAKQKNKWHQDFLSLSQNQDLILLQEAVVDDYMPKSVAEIEMHWWMAQAWKDKNQITSGVLTGSRSTPQEIFYLRSPDREPIANTAKMSLIQMFQTEAGRLVVINIHGINFVSDSAHKRQIQALIEVIDQKIKEDNQTQVVFAGDFNTWNKNRLQFLKDNLEKRGFFHPQAEKDRRNLKLDHVFVRGCEVESFEVLSSIKTSDHSPLRAVLNCVKLDRF